MRVCEVFLSTPDRQGGHSPATVRSMLWMMIDLGVDQVSFDLFFLLSNSNTCSSSDHWSLCGDEELTTRDRVQWNEVRSRSR